MIRHRTMNEPDDSRSRLLAAIDYWDRETREKRADRIAWVGQYDRLPGGAVLGPLDTMQIRTEARESFVCGQFIATVMLAMAFVEHTVVDELIERDLAKHGVAFQRALDIAEANQLFEADLLARARAMQKTRNPFAHRKEPGHEHSFGTKFKKRRVHPRTILEEDARAALVLMYDFFHAAMRSWPDE